MDAKKIKSLVKKSPTAESPSFGTDPKDPWSAKANISETALLNRYLKSRGINPGFVSKDQKVSHSKTNQFKVWMQAHINDPIKEETDKKDTVTFDIPLLIRVLELAREDIKSDMDLHRVVERLINMRDKGVLTMDEYDAIAQIKEDVMSSVSQEYINQAVEDLIESYFGPRGDKLIARSQAAHKAGDKEAGSRAHKLAMMAGEKYRKNPENAAKATAHVMSGATQDFKDQEKKRGIGNVRDHVEVEGTVVEGKEANYGGDYQQSVLAVKAKAEKKPVDMKSLAARMQASYAKDKMKKESLEPMAACNCAGDGANTPDDIEPQTKGKKLIQMSKSAKMVKAVHKKAVYGESIKEDLEDHEKQDKPDATVKKPKFEKPGTDEVTKEQPQAAAVLTGGKTLTGAPRDTIEIDPMMKMRKQTPDSQKSI
jgi:hypothetical protein